MHDDWLGGEKEVLEGFSWKGGSERDTTGILMWSKPYICKLANGEEVKLNNLKSRDWLTTLLDFTQMSH